MMFFRTVASLVLASALGCSGQAYQMARVELDPAKYDVLGKGEGKATGLMILNVIPVGQNNKIQKAVELAVAENGGDDLVNISIQESWFWAYVLNGYRVHVTGTVVKKK